MFNGHWKIVTCRTEELFLGYKEHTFSCRSPWLTSRNSDALRQQKCSGESGGDEAFQLSPLILLSGKGAK